jgi:hypothetical protein
MKHFSNNEFTNGLLFPHVGFDTVRLEEEATSGGELVKGDDGFSASREDGDERGWLLFISEVMAAGFISVVTTS